MGKKFYVIITMCLLGCGLLHAVPVDTEEARRKAAQFLIQKSVGDGRRMAPGRSPRMKLAHQRTTASGQPAFYVFNNDAGGFVIVGGDDRAEEILGYSDTGHFDASNVPDGLADLLSGYEQQISHVSSQAQHRVAKRADNGWADIEPLVLTQWNQYAPYNNLCPIDPDDGEHCVTGCTATALAQMLYYHKWPEIGYGRTSYEWRGQTLGADFSKVSFEWEKMKLEYSYDAVDEDNAVATLLYYCGLANECDYSSSSTPGHISMHKLRSLFGYQYPKHLSLSGTTLIHFEEVIYNELLQQRPVLFVADDPDKEPHEIIIDGYRSDGFFHLNLGWGGSKDGYYKLTAIDTEWYNFTVPIDIIYDIKPDYNTPSESGVYPEDSYQLSEDGTTLVKWTGDESIIHLGADATLWGVTEIGEKAFDNCTNLEAIFISSHVTDIEKNIFAGCTNLTSITVDENNTDYHESNGLIVDRYGRVIASTARASVIIPETVSDIYSHAFSNSPELKHITILGSHIYPYSDAFSADLDYSAVTLYVPQQYLSHYRNNWFWRQFGNIVGISEPSARKLTIETTDGRTAEYQLFQMPTLRNGGTSLQLTTTTGQSSTYPLSTLRRIVYGDGSPIGDVNGRGSRDVADVAALVSHLGGNTPKDFSALAADVNQDGHVDGLDVDALATAIIGRRQAESRQTDVPNLGTEPAGESPDDAAMYVWLNDGNHLRAFLMNQVAYIGCSTMGVNGISYDMPVTQLIQTRDSLYRIPLAAIDSITYQTPPPVMKQGIYIIDEKNIGLVQSVDFDTFTVTFKSGTPDAQLPKQGQVVYSDLEEAPLPMGFSGRVKSISGTTYTFESAGPEEVFDRLLMVGRIEPGGTHYNSSRRYIRRREHAEPSFTISTDLGDYISVSGTGKMILDYSFDLNAFNSEPATFYLKMNNEFTTELKVKYTKSNVVGAYDSPYVPDEKVKEVWGWPVEILSAGPIHIDVATGLYCSYGGEFSFELSGLKYKHTDIREYTWTSDNPFHIDHKELYSDGGWCDLLNNAKLKAEVAAKVSVGACAEIAAVLWKSNWMSLSLGFKVGPELKGSFAIDTDLLKQESFAQAMYKEFSENVKLTLGVKLGADLKANYKDKSWTIVSLSTTLFPKTVTLLPKLSKPSMPKILRTNDNRFMLDISDGWDDALGWIKGKPMDVKTTSSNITLFPGPIGLAIYDAGGNELCNKFIEGFENWHWVSRTSFSTPLDCYSPQTLKVYPQYKLLGFIPLKGEPAEITIPKQMTLKESSVSVGEDETCKVDIEGGWGYYCAECLPDKVATVSVKKRKDGTQYLNIIGYKAGTTTVTVTDVRSGRTQTCDVTVGSTPIKLSATKLRMREGETKIVTISPKGAYTIESSKPDVVSTFVDLTNNSGSNRLLTVIQITAHHADRATITVTDPVRCRMGTIDVEVVDINAVADPADAVDLGLPSGMLWAAWNVGASAPEEPGNYYAWGETLEKTNYSWSTYKHCDGTAETVHEMDDNICFTEYDVANNQWGGLWRMPTYEDFNELNKNCTKQWEQLKGQWGLRFTGPNGNSIFMPAAGYFAGRALNEESMKGYYWAGNFNTRSMYYKTKPTYLYLYDNSADYSFSDNQYVGYNVRPVQFDGFDNYEHGICSNPSPADGETLGGTGSFFSCNTDGWREVYQVVVSDKPDMSHSIGTTNISNHVYAVSFYNTVFQPNTKYYWQVSYFDFKTGDYRKCSPIWTFTTGSE